MSQKKKDDSKNRPFSSALVGLKKKLEEDAAKAALEKAKPALTEEQKKRLADADKARNAKKGAGSPNGAPLQGTKSGTKEPGSPFHQGGDKFDPLNGSL